MDIRYDYNSDIMSIITGSDAQNDLNYTMPDFDESQIVKLSVYNRGSYIESYELTKNDDYILNSGSVVFKPNDKLDDANLLEGNYELQYDFVERIDVNDLYIDQISQTRTEIRLRAKDAESNLSFISSSYELLRNSDNVYTFEGNLELPNNEYIPINS